jgi:hypothetical protein
MPKNQHTGTEMTRYIVSEGSWNQIFTEAADDGRESREVERFVSFLFDKKTHTILHADINTTPLSETEKLEVVESLEANDAIKNPEDWDLTLTADLPSWYTPKKMPAP